MNIRKYAIIFTLLAVLLAGTALSAGAASPMHVAAFRVAYLSGQTKTTVRVFNALNQPVSGAKVQVSFEKEGAAQIFRSTLTSLMGYARFSLALPAGNWTVCVEEIHKLGYFYDPANSLCKTISVP